MAAQDPKHLSPLVPDCTVRADIRHWSLALRSHEFEEYRIFLLVNSTGFYSLNSV